MLSFTPLIWILFCDCGNDPNIPQLGKSLILNKNGSLLLTHLCVLACELLLFLRCYGVSWNPADNIFHEPSTFLLDTIQAFLLLYASEIMSSPPISCILHTQPSHSISELSPENHTVSRMEVKGKDEVGCHLFRRLWQKPKGAEVWLEHLKDKWNGREFPGLMRNWKQTQVMDE